MAATINPPIPYAAPLKSGPARIGNWIEIRGTIPAGADTFAANLKNAGGDIGLHFNPRFGTSKVVLNSAISGNWGSEQAAELHAKRGGAFTLVFSFEKDGVVASLNEHKTHFDYRMPVTEVSQLEIRGDVKVESIREGGDDQKVATTRNPAIPFSAAFRSGPARIGAWIEIRGSVPVGADTFAANLKKAGGDIALHFNPRFGTGKLVLNSCVGGNWGAEAQSELSVKRGETFTLYIVFEADGIAATLNDRKVNFKHRLPLTEVSELELRGDVKIESIREGSEPEKNEQPEKQKKGIDKKFGPGGMFEAHLGRREGGGVDIDVHLVKRGDNSQLRDPVGEEFNSQSIDAHNLVRAHHGVPPLKITAELTASAQRWADELAAKDRFEHSTNRSDDVGENIGMKWESSGTIFTGYQATQQWYDEIDQYGFQGEENLACGHFSQVVWKGTTEAGFAKATTKEGKVIVVGHYAPAGNYVGEWAENVLPPVTGSKLQLPDWPADHPAHPIAASQKSDEYRLLDDRFIEEVLQSHNRHRAKHSAAGLSIDKDLSVIAQKHADELAANHRFEHSKNRYKNSIIGENIACKQVASAEPEPREYSAAELLDTWYAEESQYEYDGVAPKLSAGHFTQIVWKGTKVIGVGKSLDKKDNKVIVVVNYYPAGNILKRFRENVEERRHD